MTNQHFPNQQPSFEDALDHIRQSAEIIHTLGAISTSEVGDILQQEVDERTTEEAVRRTEGEKQEKADNIKGAIYEMIERLPHASAVTKLLGNVGYGFTGRITVKSPQGEKVEFLDISRYDMRDMYSSEQRVEGIQHVFQSSDVANLKVVQALVFWSDLHRQTAFIDSYGARTPRGQLQEKAEVYTEETAPYYVIGEKFLEANDEQSDAEKELLLVRATENPAEGPVIKVRVSSRLYDLTNELAIKKLKSPIDSAYGLNKYRSDGVEGFTLTAPTDSWGTDWSRILKASDHRLTKEPKRESRKQKYWEAQGRKLYSTGLPIARVWDTKLTLQDIETFNVPFYAQKLAILLGDEEAYEQTVGKKMSDEGLRRSEATS